VGPKIKLGARDKFRFGPCPIGKVVYVVRTPPDVGAAEASSAIDRPTTRMNELAMAH
jgi:hypothetical protein